MTDRESFHVLVLTPDDGKFLDWVRLKLRNRKSIWVSLMDGMA